MGTYACSSPFFAGRCEPHRRSMVMGGHPTRWRSVGELAFGFRSLWDHPFRISDWLLFLVRPLEKQVDWTDNTRDIVNFLVNFLPSKIVNTDNDDASPMPTHLPRVTSQEAQARLKRGFRSRRVVVVGHSMGGCSSYVLSLAIFIN